MDVWQANQNSAAFTPHPCSVSGPTRCSGSACGDDNDDVGFCDRDGCDFNSFRMGNTTFFGRSMTVDTTRKLTVVTQFITSDNTTNGDLVAIRRFYIQNGVVIQNALSNIAGVDQTNIITDNFCAQQKVAFGNTDYFSTLGGLKTVGDALDRGMVLALSVQDDPTTNMWWLDADYPSDQPTTDPGVARGTCGDGTVPYPVFPNPTDDASVTFSNIRFGDIGSTYGQFIVGPLPSGTLSQTSSVPLPSGTPYPPSSPTTTAPTPTSTALVPQWGQCGGLATLGQLSVLLPSLAMCSTLVSSSSKQPRSRLSGLRFADYSQCY